MRVVFKKKKYISMYLLNKIKINDKVNQFIKINKQMKNNNI